MDITIGKQDAGKSILAYLKNANIISSSHLSHLKTLDNGICVNSKRVTVRYILSENDILHIETNDSKECVSENIMPIKLPINIIYEDEHLMAVNKPVNMPTHPSHDHYDDTLGNAVAYIYKERGIPFVFRPSGRLDKNTSGVVMLPKSRAAASFYFREARSSSIKKHYIAILDGEIQAEIGKIYSIEAPIKRESDSIIKRVIASADDPEASYAKTMWQPIYSGNGISIVDVYPKTGRTHQIRVHFAHIGYSLCGDTLYGQNKYQTGCHMLHAITVRTKKCFDDSSLDLYAPPSSIMNDFVTSMTGADLQSIIEKHDFFCNFDDTK